MQEPGVPIDVDVRVDAHAALEVSANATAPSLNAVRRLQALGMNVSGEGTLRAYGALYEGELASRFTLDTHHLGVAKVAVGTAHLEASLNGPFATLTASGFALRDRSEMFVLERSSRMTCWSLSTEPRRIWRSPSVSAEARST